MLHSGLALASPIFFIHMNDLVIIKYNAGNIQSVEYALNRLGVNPVITDDPELIKSAKRVLFPGVGEASTAMNYLKERQLDKVIKDLKQPFLGICLGLQLMCKHSEENDTECLGVFDVLVKKFPNNVNGTSYKVPEIGWNALAELKTNLYKGIDEGSFVYFVHSYFAELNPHTISTTQYAEKFSSAIAKDNFYAVQYHPEKSAEVGSKIIQNFLEI
ncbi:MAG: imidazole glycerol phosphate synthase subunit HisH [Cytophagales bacterium]